MSKMYLDIETRSPVDLKNFGLYEYATHKDTEILLASVAFNDESPKTWFNYNIDSEVMKLMIVKDLEDRIYGHIANGETVVAHNAQFERVMWNNADLPFPNLEPEQLECTRAQVAAMGLPLSLEGSGASLNLQQQKDLEGKKLMLKMCVPHKKTGKYHMSLDSLIRLAKYCEQDVLATRLLDQVTFEIPLMEKAIYNLDQRINDRGFRVDIPLLINLQQLAEYEATRQSEKINLISQGVVNRVTDTTGLRKFLELDSVAKGVLEERYELEEDPIRKEVIRIRLEAGKSSVKKIDKLLNYSRTDSRIRGTLSYHGAATGRWSGSGPQPQNLPRGEIKNAEQYIPDIPNASQIPSDIPKLKLISSLLRSTIISQPNHYLVGCDLSQIEARVLAWIAGQEDLLEAFHSGIDVYKYAASKLFNIPVDKVLAPHRFKGKVTVLACGYQVGAKTFREQMKAMYGVDISESEAMDLVEGYRATNPNIVQYWKNINQTIINCIDEPTDEWILGRLKIHYTHSGHLRIRLPSGRYLTYVHATLEEDDRYGNLGVTYTGRPKAGFRSGRIRMYGGRWTENVVQAIARDVMADAMLRLETLNFNPILTVHDEIVCEVHKDDPIGDVCRAIENEMTMSPVWASDLPLAAEAWYGERYRK